MSIFSKINRIVALRNGIRSRLVTFGLANASTKLEGCKTALEGMTDNTKRTTTSNPIRGTFSSGATEQIFGKTGEGYCSTNSLIRIPVANLKPENIKSGVNVGGVVGNVEEGFNGYATFDCHSDATYLWVFDGTGMLYQSRQSYPDPFKGTHKVKGNLIVMLSVANKLASNTDFSVFFDSHLQISAGVITGPNPVIKSVSR